MNSIRYPLVFAWGTGGVLLLLFYALWRLIPFWIESMAHHWQWYHWLIFIVNILFMAYSEGFKGFQKAFSPRLAARARYLSNQELSLSSMFAPLFCMAYYAAPRRRVIATWLLTIMIVCLIILFQRLDQPLRGILDAGVVVGLSWGIVATVAFALKAWNDPGFTRDPEVV